MKRIIFSVLVISLGLLLRACNTTDPPNDEQNISLKLEDVSCTEAWIELTTTNLQLPATITLNQTNPSGDTKSEILHLNTQDSLLCIDSLLPNQSYTFQSVIQSINQSSNELSVTMMDTTSHNFTFETFTFGGTAGSSVLYDVAIISTDNIWCVGEIYEEDSYTYDSLGNWIDPYNAVRWNGNDWELKRIYFIEPNGSRLWSPIRTIFAFNENDIWFNIYIHWNGQVFEQPNTSALLGFSANKLWGTTSNDLYAVGNNGNIAHYNGQTWQQIESGTDIPLSDIYANGTNEIFISGADNLNVKGIVLHNSGPNGFNTLITSEIIPEGELFNKLYGSLSSVWVDEKNTLYTGGNILFNYKFNRWDYVRSMPENYIGGNPNVYYRGFIHSIRGKASNDYFVVGDRNTVRHFNGVTWQQIGLPYDPNSYIIWRSVCVKDNICAIVGDNVSAASILIFRK